MKHIRCVADLQLLQEDQTLPDSLRSAVETYFEELREACNVEEFGRDFELDSGHIVVLEPGDSEADLVPLLNGCPEWAEVLRHAVPYVLKCVVMWDNDYLDTYFTVLGQHPVVERWVEPYLQP